MLYEIIGCDPETERTRRVKFFELGLEWADDLLSKGAKG